MARLILFFGLFFSGAALAGGGMGAGGGGDKPGAGLARESIAGFDGMVYRGCYTTYYSWRAAQRDCPRNALAVEFQPKRWTCNCAGDATRTGGGEGGGQ